MKWLRLYTEALDDPKVQRLADHVFREKFLAAVEGEENEFSRFVSGWVTRPIGKEWWDLRDFVFQRDAFTCSYCGQVGGRLECDHIVPVSRGGESDPENLTTACRSCNRAKHARTVEEWRS